MTLRVNNEEVVSTPGQPILTHRGWVAASSIQVGDYAVAVTEQPHGVLADQAWEIAARARSDRPARVVRCPAQGFWGDAGVETDTEVLDDVNVFHGPPFATEASKPDVAPDLVWSLLARLSHPEAFGVASWGQAVARVPDLGRVWPNGQPTNRGAGISAVARARLGAAVLELPEPPEDRYPHWVYSLLSWSADLKLIKVEATERRLRRGWVFNFGCLRGAFVADGVVAGSTT